MTTVASVAVDIEIDRSKLNSDLSQVEAQLEQIKAVKIGLEIDRARLRSQFSEATAELSKLKTAEAELKVRLNSAKTKEEIAKVSADIEQTKAAKLQVTLDQSRIKGEIAGIDAELEKISAQKITLEINQGALQQAGAGQQNFGQLNGIFQAANNFQEATAQGAQFALGMQAVQQQLQGVASGFEEVKGKALDASVAFDSARAKVATLSNDADGVAKSMRQLSADLDYQVGSTQLLNASYDVLSSGFSDAADITKILSASANGAQGGFSNIGKVADVTTTILNAYKLSAGDAARVVDVLAQTQDKGKITIDQYANTVGKAASIAALSGVSFEELSAAVATATAKGVPAESSISGVRQAIVNLLKPTEDAKKLLAEFGISNSTAALKSGGLIGVLKQLDAKGATSDQLARIFSDVDALATVTPLAGSNIKDFQANLDAMANSAGKAQKSAVQVANSFEGQLTKATNQANEALISLGDGVRNSTAPLVGFAGTALQVFNALPEPLKQLAGVTLAATGGTVSLAAAMAGFLAILPVLQAGYTALNVQQNLNRVGSLGSAVATGINAAATQQLTVRMVAQSAATATDTVLTRANAAAKTVQAAATSQAAIAALKLAGTLALAAGAAYAVNEAFKRSEGAQFAQQVEDTTRKLREFREAADNAAKAPAPSSQGGQPQAPSLENVLKDKGPIEATRAALADLDQALGGTSDRTSRFGNELGNLTGEQRGAQLAQFALTAQTEEVGRTFERGREILAKYGLQQVDAADKQRLGASGIAEFKKAAEGQIQLIDRNIEALKNQKTESAAEKEQINNTINFLNRQKDAYRNRLAYLEGDTNALKKNAATQDQTKVSVESLTKALADQAAKGKLATSQQLATAKEALANNNATEAETAKATFDIEQKSIDDRIKALKDKLPALRAAKVGATGDEAKAADKALLDAEQEIATLRIQSADSVVRERKRANQEILDDDRRTAQQQLATAKNESTEAITGIRQKQLGGGISRDDAERDIAQERIAATQREYDLTQEALSQLSQRKAEGRIDEKDAIAEESRLNTQLHGLKLQQVEQEIAAREAANQRTLKDFERSIKAQESAIARQTATASLEQKRLQIEGGGGIGAEAAGIQAEQAATRARINLREQERARVQQLQQQRVIDSKEAADRERDIEQKLLEDKSRYLDLEIAKRKQAIAERFAAQKAPLDLELGRLATSDRSTNFEGRLSSTRADVVDKGFALQEQRADFAIKQAEAAGDTVQAEQLKANLYAIQNERLAVQEQSQRAQLELSIQQEASELRRLELSARKDVLDAQRELKLAQVNGASEQELNDRRQILQLADENLEGIEKERAGQEELNRLRREGLATDQAKTREQQQQNQMLDQKKADQGGSGQAAAKGSVSSQFAKSYFGKDLQLLEEAKATIARAEQRAKKDSEGNISAQDYQTALADTALQDTRFRGGKANKVLIELLNAQGYSKVAELVQQQQKGGLGNKGVEDRLDRIAKLLESNRGGGDTYNVSTATPLEDTLALVGGTRRRR